MPRIAGMVAALPRRHGATAAAAALAVSVILGAGAASAQQSPHGPISWDCEACHTTSGWTPLKSPLDFDHDATGFSLFGGHQQTDCTSCHLDLAFAHTPTACIDCHEDPHRGELGVGCEDCHAPTGWDSRLQAFELHATNLFPLTGAHASVDCAACHQGAPPFEFATTPTDCMSCHLQDYLNTTEPDHDRLGFPTACEACHGTVAWELALFEGGPGFDHDLFFPLLGQHRLLGCVDCHSAGFSGTPTDCYACHRSDYEATNDPDHRALGFPTDCELCHNPSGWEGAAFDHDALFPLTGGHRGLDCEDCHAAGFAGTPSDCYACHRDDYEGTTDPDHVAQGFPTACEDCHTTGDWGDADFDHAAVFPLTGRHRNLDCEDCHGPFGQRPPDDCYSCHRTDYEGTTDPNHVAQGFPTDCEACHTTSGWEGAEFDHSAFFRLTGAHRRLDCEACHGPFGTNPPRDCYGCHRADYEATDDPDHVAQGFPTTCEDCHNTSDWGDAEFEHDALFPLTGAHASLDCDACHGPFGPNPPRDCYGCHQADYESTNDPDHEAAGFPTDCELCHNTSNWDAGEFTQHDSLYFPIYSGSHRNTWDSCADCHVDPGNFSHFECITCHEQAEMDDEHDDVSGYVYESTACYNCHPTGQG